MGIRAIALNSHVTTVQLRRLDFRWSRSGRAPKRDCSLRNPHVTTDGPAPSPASPCPSRPARTSRARSRTETRAGGRCVAWRVLGIGEPRVSRPVSAFCAPARHRRESRARATRGSPWSPPHQLLTAGTGASGGSALAAAVVPIRAIEPGPAPRLEPFVATVALAREPSGSRSRAGRVPPRILGCRQALRFEALRRSSSVSEWLRRPRRGSPCPPRAIRARSRAENRAVRRRVAPARIPSYWPSPLARGGACLRAEPRRAFRRGRPSPAGAHGHASRASGGCSWATHRKDQADQGQK